MNEHDSTFHHQVGRMEHRIRKVLHALELVIASVTIVVLVIGLAINIWKVAADPTSFTSTMEFLHTVLNIVVGLEFVRMLIDMTPANTLEVLIMATARQIIMNHESTTALLIGIICIAILFAVRRYLIPRSDLTLDLVELD